MHFEPSLTAKKELLLVEFTGTVSSPAKTHQELVTMITEMDRKTRLVIDIMDVDGELGEIHKTSVLVGILNSKSWQ
jgi:hypothetical protein